MPPRPALPAVAVLILSGFLAGGCNRKPPDADVVVVGAGIGGLAAALEASKAGASVIVLDMNSVGGGHAVKAGGFALVDTPFQQAKGLKDSPEIAFRDLMRWGEDADPQWVRRYVEASRTEVHDWLVNLGVRFSFILDTPEHSVPRFHFAGGAAVAAVVPMMRELNQRPNVRVLYNTEAAALIIENGKVTGVRTRSVRSGLQGQLRSTTVIIATGGWQGNLDQVRQTWRKDLPFPEKVFLGAGQFANGSGLTLARSAGGVLDRMDHQAMFTAGLPDPRDPASGRALLVQNEAAIRVNADGNRFVAENAASKLTDEAALRQPSATHWLIFDADGERTLRVRDAVWLRSAKAREVLDAAPFVWRADSIAALAKAAGLPAEALEVTVARYNAMARAGTDDEFGRFTAAKADPLARPILKPPFRAIQLFPLTRKSMGGIKVAADTRVVSAAGTPIPGLLAVGEVTGVAGINGRYGGEGTFLGPAVFMGRIAGRAAAVDAGLKPAAPEPAVDPRTPPKFFKQIEPSGAPEYRAKSVLVSYEDLDKLLAANRPGFWHFGQVHRTVLERGNNCLICHTPEWPTVTAETPVQRELQLQSCTLCH